MNSIVSFPKVVIGFIKIRFFFLFSSSFFFLFFFVIEALWKYMFRATD